MGLTEEDLSEAERRKNDGEPLKKIAEDLRTTRGSLKVQLHHWRKRQGISPNKVVNNQLIPRIESVESILCQQKGVINQLIGRIETLEEGRTNAVINQLMKRIETLEEGRANAVINQLIELESTSHQHLEHSSFEFEITEQFLKEATREQLRSACRERAIPQQVKGDGSKAGMIQRLREFNSR